jgi:DNA-binding transcriptional ArsR family regulator
MKHLAKKVEREKIVLAALPELSVRIIEHAREHGRVTISDILRLTGTSRNTLKQHFRQLVAQGHLVLHGSGRGAWYALPNRMLCGIIRSHLPQTFHIAEPAYDAVGPLDAKPRLGIGNSVKERVHNRRSATQRIAVCC